MPKSEHIAYVCPRYAEGNTVGGAETLLKAQAHHAAAAGRRVSFLTTCANNHFTWENEIPEGARRDGKVEVHYFPVDTDRDLEAFSHAQELISRRARYTPEDEDAWLSNSVNSTALIGHLRKAGASYDRIVIGPYLFGLTYYASHIFPLKTFLVPCLHDEGFAYTRALRHMFQRVAGQLFNTDVERDFARRLYDLPETRCHVVGVGIDAHDTDPDATSRHHGIDGPYILYSGRREPLKGTPLLIEYFRTFRERTGRPLRLVFTGTGEISIPKEISDSVTDLGFVSEQEKLDAMAGAVSFCHPSVNESLSIVILEAWLAGTPALVHARSAVMQSQCRKSNGGLWFRDYPEFEEALLFLLDQPAGREALASAGKSFTEREYCWSAIEAKLLAALDADVS